MRAIVAMTKDWVIGRGGTIPWRYPDDMARFKMLTTNAGEGGQVVMGRKTWDSLPAKFRPLPGRENVLLTRNQDWVRTPGVHAFGSVEDLLGYVSRDAWVIGGGEVYALLMPHVTEVWVTVVPDVVPHAEDVVYMPRLEGFTVAERDYSASLVYERWVRR